MTPIVVGFIFTRKRFQRDSLLRRNYNDPILYYSVPMSKLNDELFLSIMVFWHTRHDFIMN